MSLGQVLHAPTRNPAGYLFPRNLFVFYLMALFGGGWSLLVVVFGQQWVMGSMALNLFLVGIVGIAAREQLTYAFVACLPHYQPGLRRHLVLVGVVANVLLVLVALVFYRIPAHDKLDLVLGMLFGGLALYFVLVSTVLSTPNLGLWNLIFTGLLMLPYVLRWDISPARPLQIPLGLSGYLVLPLLAVLALAWFWRLLAQPRYSRRVMDLPMPGGFDSTNSMQDIVSQSELQQRATERRRQHSRLAHWASAITIPGHSCVSDHLNVVLNRALTLLIHPALWVVVALLCVIQAQSWNARASWFGPFLMLYPLMLMMFLGKSTEVSSASPLLPYSRLERAMGMLAASLFSLLLFLAFLWLSWQLSVLLAQILHQGNIQVAGVRPRDLVLALLLCVPAFYMVQLLISMLRTGVMLVTGLGGTICMILTMVTLGAVSSRRQPGSEDLLLFWFALGWGLYLLLLYLRFRRGNLEQR